MTYSYGVEDVPDDLKLAALGIAYEQYKWAEAGGQQVTSASIGSYRLEYLGARSSVTSPDETVSRITGFFDTVNSYQLRRL